MKVILPLLTASVASAHTIFTNLQVGSTTYPQGSGVRIPSYNGPIEDVTSNSMACNGPPNPTSPTSNIITVQAGSEVNAIWRYMLSTTGTAPADIMDSTHKGPTLAYLKKVSSATGDSGVGGGWFKIQEDGFSGGVWGTEKVINGRGIHPIRIPACIEPGHYLLRAEMIALHGAGSYPGAQFYMECAQINVVGGTGTANPATVSFPGAYKGSDPGVTIGIYYPPVTNYVIPGPPVFTCGGSTTPPPPPPSTTAPAPPPPSTTSAAPPPASTSSSTGPAAAQWAQCGGIGFSGPTTCVAPYKCNVINPHYSQCY
ncbi:endoglucanase II [Plectosphaerella plurivora]|uniref:lytic cellulose monooxygenase (C4-dehydrogenating) n=1 Tax=Plectosphaerella plurivora TaxID=936078 RepID=A0A9P8V2X6_9PEZI|nr:endoglucanase II [Plectosphaerella plurivora]